MDLTIFPIVDHHAHPLSPKSATVDAEAFRQWFTESSDPQIQRQHVPQTLFLRTAVRWLAEELDCAPTLEDVLAARARLDDESWTRNLFEQANITQLFCDYGYGGAQSYSHEEMQALLPCEVRPILRLETMAEDLIRRHEKFEPMIEDFVHHLRRARSSGYVALKSIIAYRTGLAIAAADKELAKSGFAQLRAAVERGDSLRVAHKPLCDYLVWLAAQEAQRQELPLQIHTGFGDRDADLLLANPLHLRTLIENTGAPLVLLHAGWPYFRETAHLASLYSHVWLDLSLAVPFATAGIPAMIRDILGMAPMSKVLFATDAFAMPEIYWLAARWGRWGLSQALSAMVNENFLSMAEAETMARRILAENALDLYGLNL